MNETTQKAIQEFTILEETVGDALIIPFKDEILALVDKFNTSGQSGGSAPYTANVISDAVKKLCLHQPLCDIMGIDSEWCEVDKEVYQNKRLSSVFKNEKDGQPYFLDAIVFRNRDGQCFTSNGSVQLTDGSIIKSRQFINFPFTPKTFYVDVIETEWADASETVKLKGGGWWTSVVKDESQLVEVFEYYNKKE